MNRSKVPIDKLRARKQTLMQDIADLKAELEIVKKAGSKSENFTISPGLDNMSIEPEIKKTMPKINNIQNLSIIEKSRLSLYKMFSEVHITDILIKPVINETVGNNELWYQYNVEAFIDQLQFKVSYTSNRSVCDMNNSIGFPTIKDLSIEMLKPAHKIEFQNCIEYYSSNPRYISQAFLCFKHYNTLCNKRRQIIRTVLADYSDYLNVSLMREDGSLKIDLHGKYNKFIDIHMKWGFGFNNNTCMMKSILSFEIDEDDDQLCNEILPLFKLFYKCEDDENCEQKRIDIFRKVICALSDAETRNARLIKNLHQ